MKLGKPHLVGAVLLLAGSIAYNVWVFSTPRSSREAGATAPLMATGDEAATATAGARSPQQIDPLEIPAPPVVDLQAAPAFARDPFMRAFEPPPAAPAASAAAPPAAPVVRSILFSQARRLAIVDGRIVGVGDAAAGGTVVEIARDAVMVRLPSGEVQRLALKGPMERTK